MASLKSKIESILFINNQPISIKKLADLTKSENDKIKAALGELVEKYNVEGSGINIQTIGEKVEMVSAPDSSKIIKDFIKDETSGELSKAALETLTIVAYRGPVSRPEIEHIRGVNCALILRNLLIRGLVESQEDKKKMQTLYNITFDFLNFLGINSQAELPDYEKLNSSETLDKVINPEAKPEENMDNAIQETI